MEKNEKKLSVIIPCFNAEKYIMRCLNSILNQTLGTEQIELICIDDASTDGTLHCLREIERQYPDSVVVIACPVNQRQGRARNLGIERATGKYIGFVDADDWILPQMFEEMIQVAEDTQSDFVSTGICYTESEQKKARGRFATADHDQTIQISTEKQRRQLLACGMGAFGNVNVCSKLYRRDFIQENTLRFGEKYAFEDLYFSDMTAFYVEKFTLMQAEYYHYFQNSTSTMGGMNLKKWFEDRTILLLFLEECRQRNLWEKYEKEIELIFGRDYYVSILHYAFIHDTHPDQKIICDSIQKTKELFPEIMNNPYLLAASEDYLHNYQKELFSLLSCDITEETLAHACQNYQSSILAAVRKHRQTMSEPESQASQSLPEITVMIAADRNYFYPTMVFLTSLFHNHRKQKVDVWLLQMGFTPEDSTAIEALCSAWTDKQVHLIEITQERLGSLKPFGRFSVATFFRILGMRLLPTYIKKVLYLDVDMIVNQNLSELFTEKTDQPLYACYDINNDLQGNIDHHREVLGIPEGYGYFNAGMLLMDLEWIRHHHVADALIEDIEKNSSLYELVDQDALNRFYYQHMEYLPWERYDCPCVPFLSRQSDGTDLSSLIRYKELQQLTGDTPGYDITNQIISKAAILHYCTSQKPWRDQDFYQQENMQEAYAIYRRYERMYQRLEKRRHPK